MLPHISLLVQHASYHEYRDQYPCLTWLGEKLLLLPLASRCCSFPPIEVACKLQLLCILLKPIHCTTYEQTATWSRGPRLEQPCRRSYQHTCCGRCGPHPTGWLFTSSLLALVHLPCLPERRSLAPDGRLRRMHRYKYKVQTSQHTVYSRRGAQQLTC